MSKIEQLMPKLFPRLVRHDPYLGPFVGAIAERMYATAMLEKSLTTNCESIADFAQGHKYFGLHREPESSGGGWVFREWAPNAVEIHMIGDFTSWKKSDRYKLKKISPAGIWELKLPKEWLHHLDYYKLLIEWGEYGYRGAGERIPSYANYVVQDPKTKIFSACVWSPDRQYQFKHQRPKAPKAPLIYEAHVGMAQIEGKVSSYDEFRTHTLPRIVKAGYNTIQLMAVQEHPYYGSFGYQVSSFFAPSSRYGNPEALKQLIDEAHALGLRVIMDIVHSHAVKNEIEGLGRFDGTQFQYFHDGGKGQHPAWDTYCFDYGKREVLHFLLSNCRYWLEEFNFDGYRFDGVTSMLFTHHGLGKAFSSYADYFNENVDEEAVRYLTLANRVVHEYRPDATTVAEDMSGMPGACLSFEDGGMGFDYRLAMGLPDFWIRTIKECKDESWNMDHLWGEMNNRRVDDRNIAYVESHDQAIVGDQTVIFRLAGADMYEHMACAKRNLTIDRAIALHKMIRLVTISTARGGWLNFMGNEFGHPEWIDFPREGNGWSHHYARRQWHLQDNEELCYRFLGEFDRDMIRLMEGSAMLASGDPEVRFIHCDDHVLAYERHGHIFVFNFDPTRSFENYAIPASTGKYMLVLDTDAARFGGYSRLKEGFTYETTQEGKLYLYLPSRAAFVLKRQ